MTSKKKVRLNSVTASHKQSNIADHLRGRNNRAMLDSFHPMTNGSNAKTTEMIAKVLKALTSLRVFAENS
jgi:hypothetical protein